MAPSKMVLENINHAPCWPQLRFEVALLISALINDPKYSDCVKHIGELLADPSWPKAEQIYFVPPVAS